MDGTATGGSVAAASHRDAVTAMLSQDLVRSVLDSAPDAMIIIDAAGTIVFANKQVMALFGYEPREIKGQPVEILLPERFRGRHVSHRQGYATNVRIRPMGAGLDLFALRRDGTEFPVEISLSPIQDGDRTIVAAAIRDVTERRQTQLALQAANETAEAANKAKSRFLATASHDLRQPLQTLGLLNGTMRRMASDPDLLEALDQQDQAIEAMSRLLNALLDISKLESGAIKPDVTDFKVTQLFEELRREFASLAANKGLELRIERCEDLHAHSDPSLVGQVLRNLVANAIKYTRSGFVQLRCVRESPCLRLQVEDTGIGIPPDAIAHIYEEFYQVGVSTNASRDGYGLGLSIVSRIVKLLNLELDVRSQVGAGSLFSLALPESTRPGATSVQDKAPASVVAQPPVRKTHVLLVEDDPGVLNATRMLLKVEGYRVTTASSLAEALRQGSAHPDIELLITDYHLAHGERGTQVITSLRDALRPDLKAVLITGDTSSAVQDLGKDATLRIASKPIKADELLSLVRGLCGS
jgi:two-component system, sensor histidine kinase